MTDAHERRREQNRVAQAAARERSRTMGEPIGHGLDALIVDGLALMLAGRDRDDPVRLAFMHGLAKACRVRGVRASAVMSRRMGARLSIGTGLRTALAEHGVEQACS